MKERKKGVIASPLFSIQQEEEKGKWGGFDD